MRGGAESGPVERPVPCSVAVDEEVVLPCVGYPSTPRGFSLDGDLCVNEFKRALTPSGVVILWLVESRRAPTPVSLVGGILMDSGCGERMIGVASAERGVGTAGVDGAVGKEVVAGAGVERTPRMSCNPRRSSSYRACAR